MIEAIRSLSGTKRMAHGGGTKLTTVFEQHRHKSLMDTEGMATSRQEGHVFAQHGRQLMAAVVMDGEIATVLTASVKGTQVDVGPTSDSTKDIILLIFVAVVVVACLRILAKIPYIRHHQVKVGLLSCFQLKR